MSESRYVECHFDSRDSGQALPYTASNARQLGSRDYPIFTFNSITDLVVGFRVLEVSFPFVFYAISTQHNVFSFETTGTGAGTKTATLTPGNYTALEFTQILASAMTAADVGNHTYLVTYSITTNRITITQSGSDTFTMLLNAGATIATSRISRILGFNSRDANITSEASIIISPFPINLGGDSSLILRCPQLGTYLTTSLLSSSSSKSNDIIARVPIKTGRNEWSHWQNMSFQYFAISPARLNQLSFYFSYPDTDVPLSFNGLYFNMRIGLLMQNPNISDTRMMGQNQYTRSYPPGY